MHMTNLNKAFLLVFAFATGVLFITFNNESHDPVAMEYMAKVEAKKLQADGLPQRIASKENTHK